eukprot:c33431_g1_i1 orf=142-309(+)
MDPTISSSSAYLRLTCFGWISVVLGWHDIGMCHDTLHGYLVSILYDGGASKDIVR